MLDRNFKLGMDYALELDFKDPLKKFRSRFYMLENKIYMDGNSLGLCSKDALDSLNNMVRSMEKPCNRNLECRR